MSIRLYDYLIFNSRRDGTWNHGSATVCLKLFRLRGKDVAVRYSRNIAVGYSWTPLDQHYEDIKKVLRDN